MAILLLLLLLLFDKRNIERVRAFPSFSPGQSINEMFVHMPLPID
jgi:hypothetical protein